MPLLKRGYYQARNGVDPRIISFFFLEIDSDGIMWVSDCPNPQSMNPVHKRRRKPTDELLAKLRPIEGGVGDKAMLGNSKAALLVERSEKELSSQADYDLKSEDATNEMDLQMEHMVRKAGEE